MNCPVCNGKIATFPKIKHPSNIETWKACCDNPDCRLEFMGEGTTEKFAELDFYVTTIDLRVDKP
jgi:hypothetical protein